MFHLPSLNLKDKARVYTLDTLNSSLALGLYAVNEIIARSS